LPSHERRRFPFRLFASLRSATGADYFGGILAGVESTSHEVRKQVLRALFDAGTRIMAQTSRSSSLVENLNSTAQLLYAAPSPGWISRSQAALTEPIPAANDHSK
jgi:hypothetical protein